MVTLLRRFLPALAAAGLLLLVYGQLFPNEDRRIRRLLNHVATAASIPARPTPAQMILSLDRLQGCFSPGVVMVLEFPAEGQRTFRGRAELMDSVKAAWAYRRSVKVEFLDIDVKLDPAKESATADVTARATQPGDRDFFVQEFRIRLRKQSEDWRITRVESVRVLR